MRAAVLNRIGDTELTVRHDVTTTSFGPGRVRVRLHRAGLCHSDLSIMNGVLPHPAPCVPGHEGAGEVVEVGPGVKNVKVGDRVLVLWLPPCGRCPHCVRGEGHLCPAGFRNVGTPGFEVDGAPIPGMMGEGTFADEVVIPANAAVPIPDDLPYDLAALIGCGVTTGIGAALNTAKIEPGSTVVVIGVGGVGASIVQGARISGASCIVAVDPVANRREWALKLGATEAIAPEDLAETTKRLTGRVGFDYAFEAVGRPATFRTAFSAARRGGMVVLVGGGSNSDDCGLTMGELLAGAKSIMPSIFAGDDVLRTFTTIIDLWRAGLLDLESMITHHVGLTDINTAIQQMRTGEALRTIIDITEAQP